MGRGSGSFAYPAECEHKHTACRCTEELCLDLSVVCLVLDLVQKQLSVKQALAMPALLWWWALFSSS